MNDFVSVFGSSWLRNFVKRLSRKDTSQRSKLIAFVLVGITLSGYFTGCQSSNRKIVDIRRSPYTDVDRTCEALCEALEARGFANKGVLNINQSMAKHGVQLQRQVRVVQFGRSKYAHEMLLENPEVSAFMPCRFGVYEGDDGGVYVSGVNKVLMAQMFGGAVRDVMGKKVAHDENTIFSSLKFNQAGECR
jgi:uncharacterized protein (DUF302 family)